MTNSIEQMECYGKLYQRNNNEKDFRPSIVDLLL